MGSVMITFIYLTNKFKKQKMSIKNIVFYLHYSILIVPNLYFFKQFYIILLQLSKLGSHYDKNKHYSLHLLFFWFLIDVQYLLTPDYSFYNDIRIIRHVTAFVRSFVCLFNFVCLILLITAIAAMLFPYILLREPKKVFVY